MSDGATVVRLVIPALEHARRGNEIFGKLNEAWRRHFPSDDPLHLAALVYYLLYPTNPAPTKTEAYRLMGLNRHRGFRYMRQLELRGLIYLRDSVDDKRKVFVVGTKLLFDTLHDYGLECARIMTESGLAFTNITDPP